MTVKVNKSSIRITASPKAVVTRFLQLNEKRIHHIVNRLQTLTGEDIATIYNELKTNYASRHRNIEQTFIEHFNRTIDVHAEKTSTFSTEQKLLLGAMFTMEYSVKAAALFNPSIVPHPNQEGLHQGEQRFIISLRAVGEGHISSILFKTGTFDINGKITLDGEPEFFTKLSVIAGTDINGESYQLVSPAQVSLNEKVIFPGTASESMGMEDVRFVKFEEAGRSCYYGTYTAYNGRAIQTKMIETSDFDTFKIHALQGAAISDKGMALFPEKVNGKYVMVSRQGGEMMNIMFSDDLYNWKVYQQLMEPEYAWEFVQLGNCGSPVKTSRGWLLLTHGVGPMRTYVISAILLDLQDPGKIVGRLSKPMIQADGEDREGYVPNVVYTCGFMLFEGILLIPYAVSDSATGFVTIVLDELLDKMKL